MFNLQARLKKLQEGKFDRQDLSNFVLQMADPNAAVVMLPVGKWTKVGKFWILNQVIEGNLDDAFAKLVVVKDMWFIGKIKRLLYQMFKEGTWVMWWNKIPSTNLILDIWYVGDGEGCAALVVEGK